MIGLFWYEELNASEKYGVHISLLKRPFFTSMMSLFSNVPFHDQLHLYLLNTKTSTLMDTLGPTGLETLQ